MKRIATSLVDAKYGRLSLEEDKCPDSANPEGVDGGIDDEPCFVLRAQDDLALHTLVGYMNVARSIEDLSVRPSDQWFASMQKVVDSFAAFRANNSDKIKVAD